MARLIIMNPAQLVDGCYHPCIPHYICRYNTSRSLIIRERQDKKQNSCPDFATVTCTVQQSGYKLPKGYRFCVFIDVSLKAFMSSSKNLTFIVENVCEYKHWVHILESACFPPSTACVWVRLHVAFTFKATACWLFSNLWLYPKKKCALAVIIYIHNL